MDTLAAIMGYLASLLLALSLIVNNDIKFRWLNSLGCLAFIIYGILINAFPIILTNSLLLLINVYRLVKIHQTHEAFDMIEFAHDDQLIAKFISFYQKDIQDYFPEFKGIDASDEIRFAVLRDMVVANIFVAKLLPDGTAEVKINYTVPKYRDYQVGKYIFEKERKFLVSKGINKIVYDTTINKGHRKFLNVMGFTTEQTAGKVQLAKVCC